MTGEEHATTAAPTPRTGPAPSEPLGQADSFNLFLPDSEFVAATGMVNEVSEDSDVSLLEEERGG